MRNTRSGSQGQSAPPPPQSIEVVRRRARHRLIGAAILVLVAVLGFPLLFDTQPRPIPVDIPIQIPSRQSTAPATADASARARTASQATMAAAESLSAREAVVAPTAGNGAATDRNGAGTPASAPAAPAVVADAALPAKPAEVKPPTSPAAPAPEDSKPVAAKPADSKPVTPPPAKPAAETAAGSDKDKVPESANSAGNERIVVQVGAFAEVERAREARLKLERAGLKTYTHVAETPQGRRIRVRLGPYATKAEADKAAARAKALGLPAQLLWL